MRKTILIVLVLVFSAFAECQTISGYITDATTGEKIIGANIYISSLKKGTVSNTYGFYALKINTQENIEITASFVGYSHKTIKINKLDKDIWLNFKLKINNSIEEVNVTAQRDIQKIAEIGVVEIPISQIKTVPMLAGESDVMKAMQLLPGIKSGAEGQSGLYVRGGGIDQNLILLDDVPLYYVNHLGGFVSVFNTDVLSSVKLWKGGFPARFGGRLSSVMDVKMKEGNLKDFHHSVTLGLLSTKIASQGPLKKDTASYLISVRRFMYDLVSKPVTWLTNDKTATGYTFYDINAKFNYKFSDKNRIYTSFYIGNDKFSTRKKETQQTTKSKSVWGNILIAERWNHVFGNRLFSNATAYYTRYKYLSGFSYSEKEKDNTFERTYNFSSQIHDFGFKTSLDFYISDNYTLRAGSKTVFHTFKPNTTQIQQQETGTTGIDTTFFNHKYTALENTIYIENEFTLFKVISINAGLHGNAYSTRNKTFWSFSPRLILNVNFPKLFALKASYSSMNQNVHLLSYSGAGMPSDLWMPATKNAPPQNSIQFAVGLAKSFPKINLEISIEAYHKKMNNLIDYKDGAGFLGSETQNWEELIEKSGKGISKGVELLIKSNEGRLTGWVSYTLVQTTRQFANINHGNPYFYTYDATHDFSVTISYKLKANISISATWIYTTGRAITLPNERFFVPSTTFDTQTQGINYQTNYQQSLSSYYQKNDVRMKPYHRLDLGVNYTKQKKRGQSIWNIGIYNVYNRRNAYYYFISNEEIKNTDGTGSGNYERKVFKRSLFPFIPSVSYSFAF